MKSPKLQWTALGLLICLLAGCATRDIQAIAPAHEDDLIGVAPESRAYSLYRAVGFDQASQPTIEKIWTTQVERGQKLGFHWVVDHKEEWNPTGGFRLQAFAESDTRDLGPYIDRDVKYVWAASNADVAGYFGHVAAHKNMETIFLQR